ncbi:protein kinase domain-containing protein [Nitrospira sp. Kam-Ns4a]
MFNLINRRERREKAYHEGKWDQVLSLALKQLEEEPGDLKALNDLAVAYYEQEQYDQAFETCQQLQALLPTHDVLRQLSSSGLRYMRHHIVYGALLYRRGQFREALDVFTSLKCLKGHFSDKFHYAAQIFLMQGRVDQAVEEYEQMWRLRPDREQKVVKELEQIIEKHPLHTKAHRLAFEIHREKGRLQALIEEGEAAVKEGKAGPGTVYALGHYYEFQGHLDKAIRLFQQYLRRRPEDAAVRWCLTELCLKRGDVLEAIQQGRLLVEGRPDRLDAVLAKLEMAVNQLSGFRQRHVLVELFTLNLEAGRLAASRLWLERLLPLPPQEDELRIKLQEKLAAAGDQALETGDLETTRAILEQLLLLDPGNEGFQTQLRELEELLLQKRAGELEALVHSGRLSEADSLPVLQELGEIYRRRGESEDRIISVYQQLSRISFPGQAEAVLQLGLSFLRKGLADLAEKQFERFVQMPMPMDRLTECLYTMAVACESAGRHEKARELYKKILEVDLNYRDVLSRLERLPAIKDQTGQADGWTRVRERYDDIVRIGGGGMGTVYRATDRVLRRKVALKFMKDELKQAADAVQRFIREAQAASHLKHPNIIAIYDIHVGDPVFIAMEHVEGRSLREILREGPLAPELVRAIATQLCAALGYAHSQGVVHRDIKPDNILLTGEGQVKIADFGLAHLDLAVSSLTHTGALLGTPWYMAPEQILGKPVDGRTDLYALGVTLYELLTGRVPFAEGDVAYRHVHEVPLVPGLLNPKVSQPLEALVMKCLEKRPEDRPPTADALNRELQALA